MFQLINFVNINEGFVIEMEIVNIIARGQSNQSHILISELPFQKINKFSAAKIKCKGVTCQIYSSGKYLMLGLKREDDILSVTEELEKCVKLHIQNFVIPNSPEIVNVVCKFDIRRTPNLSQRSTSEFNPEICPGTIFKLNGMTIIMQHNGRGILTGSKSFSQSLSTFNQLRSLFY